MNTAIQQIKARLEILKATKAKQMDSSRRVCIADSEACLSNADLVGTEHQVGNRTKSQWIECAYARCENGAQYCWGFNRPANW